MRVDSLQIESQRALRPVEPRVSATTGRPDDAQRGGAMRSLDLDAAGFYGKTSRPGLAPRAIRPECLGCVSSLAGRYQGVRFFGGKAKRVWACRCGRARHLPVEVAAA